MRGPFGGDLSQSHWVVELRRDGFTPKPTREEWRTLYPAHKAALTHSGFKVTRHFPFPDRDAVKRAEAEREARAYAIDIMVKTGIPMFIAEGCFA